MTRPDRALETEVIGRAQGRCEYCHFPESAAELQFHIDHIIAEKHGGNTTSANLRGPASHATCAKDRISPVSIQNQEC